METGLWLFSLSLAVALSSSLLADIRGDCFSSFRRNNYNADFALSACKGAKGEEGLIALNIVLNRQEYVDEATVTTLLNMSQPYQSRCLWAFSYNNYQVNFGRRVQLCATATSAEGIETLKILASRRGSISDELLASVIASSNPFGSMCLQAFISNNYDPFYGQRVAICLKTSCREGINDLTAAVKANIDVTDEKLVQLLNERCPSF